MEHCACGSEQDYADCCGRFIEGKEIPSTPEQLMRSRYTAYTKANIAYIAKTMKSPASDRFDAEEAKRWATSLEWLRLEVIASSQESPSKGWVEFLVHFNQHQKRHVLHELSEFRCDEGQWYYIDGRSPKNLGLPIRTTHVGRNEPCLCGSGKKYKKCCGGLRDAAISA